MKSNISDNFTSTTTKYTEFNDKWSLRCIYLDKLSFYLFYLVTKWNIILTSHFVSGTARTLHCTAADGAEVLRPSYNLTTAELQPPVSWVISTEQNKYEMRTIFQCSNQWELRGVMARTDETPPREFVRWAAVQTNEITANYRAAQTRPANT